MKVLVTLALGFILLLVGTFALFNRPQGSPSIDQTPSPTPAAEEKVNFTASFTIITGNITRSFQAEKYHNLSPDVYIENSDPSLIYITKKGITWDDFFKTLPMNLTKDCLITGDGESLCTKNGTLEFFLNDIKTTTFLDEEIKNGDKALIKFTQFFVN